LKEDFIFQVVYDKSNCLANFGFPRSKDRNNEENIYADARAQSKVIIDKVKLTKEYD